MRLSQYILAHANDSQIANLGTTSHGLPVTIEHPKGTVRVLHDDKGNEVYKRHMYHSYGYIDGTKGMDGDEVDVFLGPLRNAKEAYVIHMLDKGPVVKERENEDKVFLGFPNAEAAKASFLLHYPKNFFGGLLALPIARFRQRLKNSDGKKLSAAGFATLAITYYSKGR